MIKMVLFALALTSMAPQHTLEWRDNGNVEITLTFAPEDVMDPFEEGEALLADAAEAACADKGEAEMVEEIMVRGIAVSPEGERLIVISATYACG